MSLKLAIAKLSAAAAGVALLQGGAVRVAEPLNTEAPEFSSNIDGKLIAVDPETGARYIKRQREIPLPSSAAAGLSSARLSATRSPQRVLAASPRQASPLAHSRPIFNDQ